MATFLDLSTGQLRQALELREQIESLQQKLEAVLNGKQSAPAAAAPQAKSSSSSNGDRSNKASKSGKKRTMSPEARARIAAGARARWAKVKGEPEQQEAAAPAAKSGPKGSSKKKGGLTAEGRAKLAAAMKARWAARKKGGPAPNSPSA